MNFSEYRKLTLNTMSQTGKKVTDSTHMTLGLNTEIMGELPDAIIAQDLVNFKEEIGDAFWYLANYCNIWEIEPTRDNELPSETFGAAELDPRSGDQFMLIFSLGQNIALLQDLDKKDLAYGKAGDENVRLSLTNVIYNMLEATAFIFGIDTDKVRATNIAKLQARYPDKFTNESAVNRNLEVEREILEKD